MQRDRKSILQEVGRRLKKMREERNYPPKEMAAKMRIETNTYYKNENGETFPSLVSLDLLQQEFGISMDWLIFNKEPMYYQEKKPEKTEEEKPPPLEETMPEVKELLEHMAKDPLLRHEVLLNFYKYRDKKKNQEITES
ncbi:MAG: helix-turn-helix domain-containing protein [Candidatus Aminicenantes bacterium]|nr:helix-turn-helix domain-containing protein [Candidatus Aminicenantes bacterium]NIM79852.1 helix-turn-helix domain-containing protein [Candidatus Aminicenantes bacterium]NIN19185.1 helix-turn-helix domain-containing protein [Candidatus Aminicenantes bacterium]NIN43093.1 helix-turn-helix domain-containing protein [Candidatus Aminicenantes bacterium]NIN85830.1 helix-turn-helix domain-containing protein [Candidatus Aminicenantes bacterium]